MNGEEIQPEPSSKDLIEHAAVAFEEVQRTIAKVRKDGLKDSGTKKATQTALQDVQRQIDELYPEVLWALGEFPETKWEDYISDGSSERWEASSDSPSEDADQVSNDTKQLTEKVVLKSSEKPPLLADSKNTDIEDALTKPADIALKEVELPEKSSESSEPPPPYQDDSKNTDMKDTMQKEAAILPNKVDRKPKSLTEQINLLTEIIPIERSESFEKWGLPSDDGEQQLIEKVALDSSRPPSYSEKPPLLADSKNTDVEKKLAAVVPNEVNRKRKKLTKKRSQFLNPSDSENSEAEQNMKKVEAIMLGDSKKARKPPSGSEDEPIKRNLEETVAHNKSLLVVENLTNNVSETFSENGLTDEAKEDAEEDTRLFEEVDRKFEKLFEEVALAEGALPEPTDSKDCCPERAVERFLNPSDSDNSEAEQNMKKEAIMLGDPKKARKPPLESEDEPIKRTLEETVAHEESLLVVENLTNNVSETCSENGLTDEAEEVAEEDARIFEIVDRKFEKLFEEVALAEEALPEPTDSKDCCPERAVERTGLSNNMSRIFEKLNEKKQKKNPLSLRKPAAVSKK